MHQNPCYFDDCAEARDVRRRIARFARDIIAPQAAALDEEERFSAELTAKLADEGLLGCLVEQQYGGGAWDKRAYLAAIEEIARVDGSQAALVASHNSLGVGSLRAYGSEEQKQRYLPLLCSGRLWGFGLSESHGGSDVQNIQTTASWDAHSKEWVLTGEKCWITNTGHEICAGLTVLAATGESGVSGGSNTEGGAGASQRGADHPPSKERVGRRNKEYSCFLVPLPIAGLQVRPIKGKMMWRATSTAHLVFSEVRLPAEALLGERGRGFAQMMSLLDEGRLSLTALALGLAKEVFDLALGYAQKRHAFGKPLISHQGVGFKLADMAVKIETAEALMLKALAFEGRGREYSQRASMAKLYSSEVAEFCTREAQQIFAARGLIKPHVVERHYRDAALLRIGEGASEIQRMIIARSLVPYGSGADGPAPSSLL